MFRGKPHYPVRGKFRYPPQPPFPLASPSLHRHVHCTVQRPGNDVFMRFSKHSPERKRPWILRRKPQNSRPILCCYRIAVFVLLRIMDIAPKQSLLFKLLGGWLELTSFLWFFMDLLSILFKKSLIFVLTKIFRAKIEPSIAAISFIYQYAI